MKTYIHLLRNKLWIPVFHSSMGRVIWKTLLWTIIFYWIITISINIRESNLEKKRRHIKDEWLHCMNSICKNDTPPSPPPGMRVVKFDYTWYFIPQEYTGNVPISFALSWPRKTAYLPRIEYPDEMLSKNFLPITVRLTDRSRSGGRRGDPLSFRYTWLLAEEKKGFVSAKIKIRDGLELWQLTSGGSYSYFVLPKIKMYNGTVPALACRSIDSYCEAVISWADGAFADLLFNFRLGPDWPEIYAELHHILQQFKKVKK